jgi:hypothetical protein
VSDDATTPAETQPETPVDDRPATRRGLGRLLIAIYVVLAIGATVRSLWELLTKFELAPLSYLLSAVAAVVYVVITYCLIKGTPRLRRIARGLMWFELTGVLVVGTLSVVAKDLFPVNPETGRTISSVWYLYGRDYIWLPLILPILGLWFLRKQDH